MESGQLLLQEVWSMVLISVFLLSWEGGSWSNLFNLYVMKVPDTLKVI